MADASLTWLGHASFRLDTPGGKRVYVDPWLSNPKCPDSEKDPERIDVIAITHGHGDHVGETVELSKKFKPEIVANSSGRNHAAARLSHAISMTDAPSPTRSRPANATPKVDAPPKTAAPSPIVAPPSASVQRGPSVSVRPPATSAIAANT